MTLQRRTPLRAGKPLERRPFKPKREDPAVRAFRAAVRARAAGVCEARTPSCWGVVDPSFIHAHHVAGRGSHDPSNGLGVCPPCHIHIHAHPAVSYERGWLKHRNWTDSDGAT